MVSIVHFTPYNPEWPHLFEKEAKGLTAVLGDNCLKVHHIGSTSVPGLSAKAIIDILVVVKDILKVDAEALETLGYQGRGEMGMPFRRYFSNGSYHIHIWQEGSDEIQKHLLFRDYLRTHAETRTAYQALKEDLAEKFKNDRATYTLKKDPFIKTVLKQAGFEGFEFVQPMSSEDWHHYHRIRTDQIFARHSHVVYDPHHPTLTDPAHFHFILKKLDAVLGVAHVELLDDKRAALRPFAIDAPYQNQGYGTYLLKLVEKWILHQGRSVIQLHANPPALGFYQRAGYEPSPFIESGQEERDYLERAKMGGASYIDLRKILKL